MPLGEFLVAYLRRLGWKRIFGIPGDLVLRLFSQLGERGRWKIVTLSHEPAVASRGTATRADGIARRRLRDLRRGRHNMVNAVAGSYASTCRCWFSGGPGDESASSVR